MRFNEFNWGFLLISIITLLLALHFAGCQSAMCSSCPKPGHGPCPFNPAKCCQKHEHN